MTKYLWMNLRSLLTNPYLLFWSIAFVEFWVFMWVYVFGTGIPNVEAAVLGYCATAFGPIVILSISSAASGIAMTILYASKSVRYITKYTKLSPSRFLAENLLSSVLALLVISGVMFVSLLGVFSSKFGLTPLPKAPIGLSLIILLAALFEYLLSLFLSLLLVYLRAPRAASFISFVPLVLGFLPYISLWINFGSAVYVSPFNCIASLCYYYYSGDIPPTGGFFMPGANTLVDVNLASVSLVGWLIALILIDVYLLSKMRGVGMEEVRII